MIGKHRFRPVSISLQNISGMTTDLVFFTKKVPIPKLIAIYGHNRVGKTKIIDGIKYTITGFKPVLPKSSKLELILGTAQSGHSSFVFEYRGVLYKIQRNLKSSGNIEKVTFVSSNMKTADYLGKKSQFRDVAWTGDNLRKVYMKDQEVKLQPSNFQEQYNQIFVDIDLKKSILERMIAKENVEEFRRAVRNAMETIAGKTELGYYGVKKILSAELIELQETIDKSLKANNKTTKKVGEYSSLLQRNHQSWMKEIVEKILEYDLEKADLDKIKRAIHHLKLHGDPERNLQVSQNALVSIKDYFDSEIRNFSRKISWGDSNKKRFEDLEECLGDVNLGKMHETVTNYPEIYQKYREFHNTANSMLVNIDENIETIKDLSFNFTAILHEEVEEVVRQFDLPTMVEKTVIKLIHSQSQEVYSFINSTARLTKRKKELMDKYKVSSSTEIWTQKEELGLQLRKIENPPARSELKDVFPILGKEQDGNIQVYMSLSALKTHVSSGKPLKFVQYIIPFKEKGEEIISKNIVKELSKDIEKRIKELEELDDLFSKLKHDISHAAEIQEILQNVDRSIMSINTIIEKWSDRIIQFKSISNHLLTKNLEGYFVEDDLIKIISTLEKIKREWEKELRNNMLKSFKSNKNLSENLMQFLEEMKQMKEHTDSFCQCIDNTVSEIDRYQGEYKTIHEEYNTSNHLLDIVFPLIEVVSSQVRANINLEDIDKRILKEIANQSTKLYKGITSEDNLVIHEDIDINGEMFLNFSIKKPDGTEIPILDTDPSGSEQAAISLGAMYALAKLFDTFLVMDEISDKFDHISKRNFYQAVNTVSEDVITLIVLKIDRPDDEIDEELTEMMDSFQDAIFIQAFKKIDGTLTAKVLDEPSSFRKREV